MIGALFLGAVAVNAVIKTVEFLKEVNADASSGHRPEGPAAS